MKLHTTVYFESRTLNLMEVPTTSLYLMETATADFTKNTFIIYFDRNCRTAFFQNTSLRSKRVGMNLTHHTVSSTFLTLKCHSVFFFLIRKERKTGFK